MQASVLPLTWPTGVDALDHTRFETDARLLRYQALGRACRANNIFHLMVAHHADDQAETIMMRLMNKRLRSGLRGMQTIEWIPECYGLYGVHHSGQQQEPGASRHLPFPIEQGGIRTVRPLLGFEKSRLIATCETQGVAWAEDKTNHIQTYTLRNAIRHVYKNHALPAALSIQSLVKVSLTMKKRIDSHKKYAEMLFDKCLIKLNIQTGSMIVRLPPYRSLLDCPIETTVDVNEAKNNAYYLLKRVAELVTPRTKAPIAPLAATIENIWPEFRDSKDKALSGTDAGQADKAWCVHGIWWRWWGKPSPFEKDAVSVWGFAKQSPHPREWLLMRQPPSTSREGKLGAQIEYPPTRNADAPADGGYQLFDGRYWIQIQNHTRDTLMLRFFKPEDMHHVPSLQSSKSHQGRHPGRFIRAVFAQLEPKVRFTLPAVFRVDNTTGAESLVGFPTLGVSMNTLGAPADVCEWKVRYMKIDAGSRGVEDMVMPGILVHDRSKKVQGGRPAKDMSSAPQKVRRVPFETRRERDV
jgi:tRNA(Ile)-lysidine synthase